jgi:hypothetical protein
MMLDALSVEIEQLAKENGSYIDAVLYFQAARKINDVEDIIEILHPIVVQRIKDEFIKKNFIRGIKVENPIPESFFD